MCVACGYTWNIVTNEISIIYCILWPFSKHWPSLYWNFTYKVYDGKKEKEIQRKKIYLKFFGPNIWNILTIWTFLLHAVERLTQIQKEMPYWFTTPLSQSLAPFFVPFLHSKVWISFHLSFTTSVLFSNGIVIGVALPLFSSDSDNNLNFILNEMKWMKELCHIINRIFWVMNEGGWFESKIQTDFGLDMIVVEFKCYILLYKYQNWNVIVWNNSVLKMNRWIWYRLIGI